MKVSMGERGGVGSSRVVFLCLGLALAALLALAVGASVGSTGIDSLWQARQQAAAWQIVVDIRLPRTLGAWLAGALLGLAGAVAQGLFRNPLADPFLLGSASGAALAVALFHVTLASTTGWVAGGVMASWLVPLGLTGAAFVGALAGVLLALILARGVRQTLRLLLAGIVVGFVLGAARDLLQLANPSVLQAMQGFALGTTGFVDWKSCVLMAGGLLPLLLVALGFSRVLDALSLGDDTAQSLGLPLGISQAVLVAVLALATGVAVAQTGLIGFIGLVAPHLARALARCTHGPLLLLSTLVGGLLLMVADILARLVMAPRELPVGVLTAVLGGSYLLWLMHRNARGDAMVGS